MIVTNPFIAATQRAAWQAGYSGQLLSTFVNEAQKSAYMQGQAMRATQLKEQKK